MSPQFPEPNKNYLDEVAKDRIEGSSSLVQVGNTPVVSNSILDVWAFGDQVLTFIAPTTASIDSISSSSVNDVGISIFISGLDASFLEVTQIVVLDGQNTVALSVPLIRVNQCVNFSGTFTATVAQELDGNVYVYENTPTAGGIPIDPNKVKEFIPFGFENSKHARLSIPANKKLNFKKFVASLSKQNNGSIIFNVYRQVFGGVPILIDKFDVNTNGTSSLDVDIPLPFNLLPTEDVWFTAEIIGSNIGASIIFNGELYIF